MPRNIYRDQPTDEEHAHLAAQEFRNIAVDLHQVLESLLEEYDDRRAQYGSDYLWNKHENQIVITLARETLTRTAHLVPCKPPTKPSTPPAHGSPTSSKPCAAPAPTGPQTSALTTKPSANFSSSSSSKSPSP